MPGPNTFNPWQLFVGAFIPNWLVERPELSPGAKLCYARLCQYAGRAGVAFPAQEELAAALGVSDRQVRTYLVQLQTVTHDGAPAPLIRVTQGGRARSNRITFLVHPWMGLDANVDNSWTEPKQAEVSFRSDRKETAGPIVRDSEKRFSEARRVAARSPTAPPSHSRMDDVLSGLHRWVSMPGAAMPGVRASTIDAVRARLDVLKPDERRKLSKFGGWLAGQGVGDEELQVIVADLLSRPEISNPYAYYAAGSDARVRLKRATI